MNPSLAPKWITALSLSQRRVPEFYQSAAEIQQGPYAEALQLSFAELGLAAVFCIEGVPTIGFLAESDPTPERIDLVHRALWNQGLMSLLLVVKDDELIAYSLVRRPFVRDGDPSADPRLITTLSLVGDALKLRELIHSTESGRFWYENENFFDPRQRVDNVLLSNLLHAFREVKNDLGAEAAQALLIQTMFIAYLEDRKIIDDKLFLQASGNKSKTFLELLRSCTPTAFEKLFVWLKNAFNGDIFNAPCAFDVDGTDPPRLRPHHLPVLARFRDGREEMASRQLRFWGYDFRYIPITLISAVYDRFLKEQADKRNTEGAFYTPMFLADLVVGQVWEELTPEQRNSGIFYDPACGSGIFLVRLFQRLVAHHCHAKGKQYASWTELKSIAQRLHGGDIDASAVRVAAFSLYIALLEYSNPPDLPALIRRGKLLPSLYRDTLRPSEDFFGTPDEGRYDVVIGNPPWKGRAGQISTAQEWASEQELPIPAKDIAWGFVWKALRVLKQDGFIGLLLPAMGVLHNASVEAQEARRLLLHTSRIRKIINFSDLCFQLFDGAQRPTAFVLYQGTTGYNPYRFEYWSPKADLNLRLKRLLTLARSDRSRLRSDDAEKEPSLFKRRLWMRSPDEKLLQFLRVTPPLGHLVMQYKQLHDGKFDRSIWMIGQGFQPAQSELIGRSGYRITTAPAVTRLPYLSMERFRALALPKINTEPWPHRTVRRVGFTAGFYGPHILIPQGVERSTGRVRAAYTEQSLAFEHSLQAIVFPHEERATAKLLTAVLNSRLAAWFYFHETANFGTDRAKVIQADLLKLPFASIGCMPDPRRAVISAQKIVQIIDEEIDGATNLLRPQSEVLDQIDAFVYDYYGLDPHDVALIEDTFRYIIPAMQPRRSAGLQAIWSNSRAEHRRTYASMLCDALKPWFNRPINASLIAKSSDIAVLRLTLSVDQLEQVYGEESLSDVDQLLQKISSHLSIPMPGNVQLMPDLRFVIGQEMYLVKPLQLRYWLQSAALADAAQIAAEFSALTARPEWREVQSARG